MSSENVSVVSALIMETENKLNLSLRSKQITDELVNSFGLLSEKFKELANDFYAVFQDDFVNQLVSFGALSNASNICAGLKFNLGEAKARGENPIAAEKVADNNYLLYLNVIADSFKSVQKEKTISENAFETINESIKNLVTLAKSDNIYSEFPVKFSTSDGKAKFIEIMNNTNDLFL